MGIFSWFGAKKNTNETKTEVRLPVPIDWTENEVVNADLTEGLYYNSASGYKLAASLAWAPIAIPVGFMGLPVPKVDNTQWQEILNQVVAQKAQQMGQIHTLSHVNGTCWVWPHFSAKTGTIIWEFIPDNTIEIIKDLDTGEPIQVFADDQLTVNIRKDQQTYVRRRRTWTKTRIDVEYDGGSLPGDLKARSMRNVTGDLPIYFSNNPKPGYVRGLSDYARIVYDLKNYHKVELAISQMLAMFRVKMVQTLAPGSDVATWLASNGKTSLNEIRPDEIDLIFNRDGEKTEFIFPDGALDPYEKRLETVYYKIVEGSGLPELAWGLKMTGNHASVEEDMATLVRYAQSKQAPKNNAYRKLFLATSKLLGLSNIQEPPEAIDIEWNALSSVSESVKAEIFSKFASAVSSLMGSVGITLEQVHFMWKQNFPGATPEDFDKFKVQMDNAARFKQYATANFLDALDAAGSTTIDGQ